jgi:c-di-GMP-binding flagellar brake protein YcgR
MQGSPGIDFPEDRSPVDVLAASRGDAVMSFVETITDDELLVSVGQDRAGRPVRLQAGERLEIVWKDAGELRSLPVELVAVETAPQQLWRLRPVGPAARGQRRAAVRAPLSFRAALEHAGVSADGTTVDLSEGGVRAWFELTAPVGAAPVPATGAPGAPAQDAPEAPGADDTRAAGSGSSGAPDVGTVVSLTVFFGDREQITAQAEVTREHGRNDRRAELSLRFIGLPEKMQDRIRREVFAGLRDLRARGML